MKVTNFNQERIDKLVKDSDPYLKKYIKALKDSNKRFRDLQFKTLSAYKKCFIEIEKIKQALKEETYFVRVWIEPREEDHFFMKTFSGIPTKEQIQKEYAHKRNLDNFKFEEWDSYKVEKIE